MAATSTPVDPRVKMPASVVAQAKLADDIIKQVYTPESDALKEPPAEGDKPIDKQVNGKDQTGDDKPAAPVTAQVHKLEEKPKEPKPAPAEVRDWEHDAKTWKGRHDKQVEQTRLLSQRLGEMERLMAELQAKPAPKVDVPVMPQRLITQQEETDYGSEFLNVVAKKAREELLPVIAKQEVEIENLRAQLNGVGNLVTQDAHERMRSLLTQRVPNWLEINTQKEFLDWLALPDPYSGNIRQNMLTAAWNASDGPRVANFFHGFLAEEAALAPATTIQPAVNAKPAKPSLESFVAPGRAKTAATNPAEKPTYTARQISQFYQDAAAGKYAGREAEKAAIEADIFAAQRERRIISS
jgi:hypothetical protein